MTRRLMVYGGLVLAMLLCPGPASAQESSAAAPAPVSAKLDDFAWLAGHWEADLGETQGEELCTRPSSHTMTCMVRFIKGEQTTGMEFAVLEDHFGRVEEHIRFFSPVLAEGEGARAVGFELARASAGEAVFENRSSSGPRSVTITRHGGDALSVHIALIDKEGKSRFIDALWKRAKD